MPTDRTIVAGQKFWQHGTNPESRQPGSVTIHILANGEPYMSFALDASTDWKFRYDLAKYDQDGNEIIYTIDETTVKDYAKSIDGYNVTNCHKSIESGVPRTGDESNPWLWFGLTVASLGAVGITTACLIKRRRMRNEAIEKTKG